MTTLLTQNDLTSLVTLINHQVSKIQKKVSTEKNPKIIHFKIRAFIEHIKEICEQHESPQEFFRSHYDSVEPQKPTIITVKDDTP